MSDTTPNPTHTTARDLGRLFPSAFSVLVVLGVVGLTVLFVVIRWWEATEGGR